MLAAFSAFNIPCLTMGYRLLLFSISLLLPVQQLYALPHLSNNASTPSQRTLFISNFSTNHFDISMYLFENTQAITPVSTVAAGQNTTLVLQNRHAPFANATVWFKLADHTVFSVVMVDALTSVQGCKSQNTLFHKSNYTCKLEQTRTGLHLKIVSVP